MRNQNQEPLTTEEIAGGIFARAKDGNQTARDRIVLSCMGLACQIAAEHNDFAGRNLPDLQSAAVLGVCEAVDRFEPERGLKFSTLATWHIRKHVLGYIIANHGIVHLGKTAAGRKLFFRLRREQAKLQADGKDASPEALADALGVTVADVQSIEANLTGTASLDADDPINGGSKLLDRIACSNPDPEALAIEKARLEWVRDRMIRFEQTLDAVEMVIWNGRIASEHADRITLDDLSGRVGLTRQRCNQIEQDLIARFAAEARRDERKNDTRLRARARARAR
jgi:RNA polymerase sigma-32 factor